MISWRGLVSLEIESVESAAGEVFECTGSCGQREIERESGPETIVVRKYTC